MVINEKSKYTAYGLLVLSVLLASVWAVRFIYRTKATAVITKTEQGGHTKPLLQAQRAQSDLQGALAPRTASEKSLFPLTQLAKPPLASLKAAINSKDSERIGPLKTTLRQLAKEDPRVLELLLETLERAGGQDEYQVALLQIVERLGDAKTGERLANFVGREFAQEVREAALLALSKEKVTAELLNNEFLSSTIDSSQYGLGELYYKSAAINERLANLLYSETSVNFIGKIINALFYYRDSIAPLAPRLSELLPNLQDEPAKRAVIGILSRVDPVQYEHQIAAIALNEESGAIRLCALQNLRSCSQDVYIKALNDSMEKDNSIKVVKGALSLTADLIVEAETGTRGALQLSPDVVRSLRASLETMATSHPDPTYRVSALNALSDAAGNSSVFPIVQLLQSDPDTRVQQAAVYALGDIGRMEGISNDKRDYVLSVLRSRVATETSADLKVALQYVLRNQR